MQDRLHKFRLQFIEETRERIQTINNLAITLEKDASRQDLVEQLKREMHTIKGGSRILGLKSVAQLAHFFEDFFVQVMSGDRALPTRITDRLFRALDLMGELLDADDDEALFRRVEDFLQRFKDEDLAEPPPPGSVSPQDRVKQLLKDKLRSRFQGAQAPGEGPAPPAPAAPDDSPLPEPPSPPPAAGELPGPPPAKAGRPPLPPEDRRQGFSKSFRIDSNLIDTISDGALQLKVMTSFFNVFQSEYAGLVQSVRRLQDDLASTLPAIADTSVRNRVESVQILLRDLARTSQEKKKLINNRLVTYQNYFDTLFRNIEDLKLIPLATLFAVFPRFVRDYAVRNDKEIDFEHQGGSTRLDKRIAEAVNESLIHLLRNAVDHGIETPDERERAGKPRSGRITLSASTQGDRVVITVTDDGYGFDPAKIRESALKKRLITEEEAARMSPDEVTQLVFRPGFSTAPIITDTSGRGVGMDVVQHAVNNFHGSIRIETEPGAGASVRMILPISISTTRILHVRDRDEVLAIPADAIRKVRRVHLSDLTRRGEIFFLLDKGECLPTATVSSILGSDGELPASGRDAKILLTLQADKDRYGLLVDQTLHEENAIVHRKDPFIRNTPYIAGVSVSIFGEPFLVFDIYALARYFQAPRKTATTRPAGTRAKSVQKVILLVEDSVVTREMEKVIIESAGYRVVEAVNGAEGLEKLGTQPVDCIVTDVEMPVMDGFTMTGQIRGIPAHRDIPIIIVTTRENREDKIRGIQVGANAYITKKDFDQMKLLETIQRLV
ncbi:MAG: response regulator [Acidobacteria bacterium]|nr:response regulator [Acidobacteriota bacterium]